MNESSAASGKIISPFASSSTSPQDSTEAGAFILTEDSTSTFAQRSATMRLRAFL